MNAINKFFDEHYRWKAEKDKHREKILVLKRAAHKEFYNNNRSWFKILDYMGAILICVNLIALLLTNALIVKVNPDKDFVEANPAQCEWNGYTCHSDANNIMLSFLKFAIVWVILIGLYVYNRQHTFSYTGMWIITMILIYAATIMSLDAFNNIGLYLGKMAYGVIVS